MGHQRTAQFGLVAGVDRLLPIQRQAVGIFGDGDLGQKRLRRNAAFDDMGRRRGLDHAVAAAIGVFRAAGHDHPELRRRHVETLRHVLANQDLLQILAAGRDLWLNNLLDPLQVRRKALARPRRALRLVLGPCLQFGVDRRHAGLDLVEHEVDLLIVQPFPAQAFRARAVKHAFKRLDDRRQLRNSRIGGCIDQLESRDLGGNAAILRLHRRALLDCGQDHRLKRINIVRKLGNGRHHRR